MIIIEVEYAFKLKYSDTSYSLPSPTDKTLIIAQTENIWVDDIKSRLIENNCYYGIDSNVVFHHFQINELRQDDVLGKPLIFD